ncbi:hypothetical protein C2845_PM05G17610 [Panicum miliaceum]|uniref:Uncharacterized protein n=1 Tax=Panicum miliaceum TaxID=4540 RepID=A0A3L6SYD2_PANMI|nr:hypothetical protein C2845_PM05G17610 [Panicum miliaceum]
MTVGDRNTRQLDGARRRRRLTLAPGAFSPAGGFTARDDFQVDSFSVARWNGEDATLEATFDTQQEEKKQGPAEEDQGPSSTKNEGNLPIQLPPPPVQAHLPLRRGQTEARPLRRLRHDPPCKRALCHLTRVHRHRVVTVVAAGRLDVAAAKVTTEVLDIVAVEGEARTMPRHREMATIMLGGVAVEMQVCRDGATSHAAKVTNLMAVAK